MVNHTEDEVVLFDASFAPLIKGIAAHCSKVRALVCLADAANTPAVEDVSILTRTDRLKSAAE